MSLTEEKAQESVFERTPAHRRVEDLFHRTSRNFLVLGNAGTGKSHLLRHLVESSRKKVAVVSYTGLAAIQAGGQTINRFFGLAPGLQPRCNLQPGVANPDNYRRLRDLDVVLIDEVSMLRADMFDALEAVLKEHGPRPGELFGGVQVGLFGDPLQLPPIVEDNEHQAFNGNWQEGWPSPWFFDALAFRTGDFVRVTLQRIFRQNKNDDFTSFLGRLRDGRVQPGDFDFINARVSSAQPGGAVALVTTNAIANRENENRYNALNGPVSRWTAKSESWPDKWRNHEPVQPMVEVKVGARVLVCANGAGPGLVNGSVGTVSHFDGEAVYIHINGGEVPVRRYTWEFPIWDWNPEQRRMFKSGTARYTQMPLKLAWALTIHKAQGQTIDGLVWVDLGNRVWSGGQTYVALSRVRRLDQIHLRRPMRQADILLENRAVEFLAEGDTPTTVNEVRAKMTEVYQQTRRIRDDAESKRQAIARDRHDLQGLLDDARQVLVAVKQSAVEARQLAAQVSDAERKVALALEKARQAHWLRRLLGRF